MANDTITRKPFVKSGNGHYDKVHDLIEVARPIEVYRNLQRNCWSIRQGGIVVLHTDYICLKDCEFVVSKAGRERVLKEKRKNVHAFVRGYLCLPSQVPRLGCWSEVSYNPYKYDSFFIVGKDHKIQSSMYVDMIIDDQPVLAYSPK